MAKLVDMKRTKAEKKEQGTLCKPMDDPYGYGLRVNLNDSELSKLGIDSLPKVGKSFTLTAKVEVIAARQSQSTNHNDRSIELQIQKLALESGSAEDAMDEAIEEANS